MEACRSRAVGLDARERDLTAREAQVHEQEARLLERGERLAGREDYTALGELVPQILGGLVAYSPALYRVLRRQNSHSGSRSRPLTTLVNPTLMTRLRTILRDVMRKDFVPRKDHEAQLEELRKALRRAEEEKADVLRVKGMVVLDFESAAKRQEDHIEALKRFLEDPQRLTREQSLIVELHYAEVFGAKVESAWRGARWTKECFALCGACHSGSHPPWEADMATLYPMWRRGQRVRLSCPRCRRVSLYDPITFLAAATGAVIPLEVE